MPRANERPERRAEFVPVLARAFAELGFRRTTTAELAARCGVRENILYRLWPDKRAMFVAALEHVYALSESRWEALLADAGGRSPAEVILDYEARHLGEFGLYRLVFAGLSEADDELIRDALRTHYGRFQRYVARQVRAHHAKSEGAQHVDPKLAAWAIIGLGTVSTLGRELELISAAARRRLIAEFGRLLLGAEPQG